MTEQKELYTLANVMAPSGVPPSEADSSTELESTAKDERPPRLLVDLSEIRNKTGQDSSTVDIFEGEDSEDDFDDLGQDNVEPVQMSLTNNEEATADLETTREVEDQEDLFEATAMPPPQSQVN